MKLTDIKGEQALDVLADILEPAAEIMMDKEFLENVRGGNRLKAARIAIKNHKTAIITIMALLNGKTVETYDFNIVTLPLQVLQLLNDPEAMILFQSQGLNVVAGRSGSATENTQEAAE